MMFHAVSGWVFMAIEASVKAGDGCDNGKVEPGYVCVYQGRCGDSSCKQIGAQQWL